MVEIENENQHTRHIVWCKMIFAIVNNFVLYMCVLSGRSLQLFLSRSPRILNIIMKKKVKNKILIKYNNSRTNVACTCAVRNAMIYTFAELNCTLHSPKCTHSLTVELKGSGMKSVRRSELRISCIIRYLLYLDALNQLEWITLVSCSHQITVWCVAQCTRRIFSFRNVSVCADLFITFILQFSSHHLTHTFVLSHSVWHLILHFDQVFFPPSLPFKSTVGTTLMFGCSWLVHLISFSH